jgi:hypothetical protein
LSLSLLNDVQSRVRWILVTVPESRNYTENEFLFYYWRMWEGFGSGEEKPKLLTSHESISRCKRKLVEQNDAFKADKNIQRSKIIKEEVFKEWSRR